MPATQEKFLIEEMLKEKGEIVNGQLSPNLRFIPYPSPAEVAQNFRNRDFSGKITNLPNHTKVFIGQLTNYIPMSSFTLILERIFGEKFIANFTSGNRNNNSFSPFGFITIPNDKVEILEQYNHAIRPDRNGVWVARNDDGKAILGSIENEIRQNRNISELYNLNYNYCKEFSSNNIIIERKKNFNRPDDQKQKLLEIESELNKLRSAIANHSQHHTIIRGMSELIHSIQVIRDSQNTGNNALLINHFNLNKSAPAEASPNNNSPKQQTKSSLYKAFMGE